jgi:hypothetical protein
LRFARLAATEGQPYRSPCHLLRFTICDLRAPGGHGGPALQITVSPFTIYDLRFARAWRPRRASPTDHRVTFYDLRFAICARLAATEGQPYRSPCHPLTPSPAHPFIFPLPLANLFIVWYTLTQKFPDLRCRAEA